VQWNVFILGYYHKKIDGQNCYCVGHIVQLKYSCDLKYSVTHLNPFTVILSRRGHVFQSYVLFSFACIYISITGLRLHTARTSHGVLYAYESWYVTLRTQIENIWSFVVCTLYYKDQMKANEISRRFDSMHGRDWGMHANLWSEDLMGDLCLDGMIVLYWTLRKQGMSLWTGFVWHRIGSSGGLLWTW
jgi:hypothetical protein